MNRESLDYIAITGPGVDLYNNRREIGSLVEISEDQLRESIKKALPEIIPGLKVLLAAPLRNAKTEQG